jgi:hypothetical protein
MRSLSILLLIEHSFRWKGCLPKVLNERFSRVSRRDAVDVRGGRKEGVEMVLAVIASREEIKSRR